MSGIDPSRQADLDPIQVPPSRVPAAADAPEPEPSPAPAAGEQSGAETDAADRRRRILIGSQRDPAAYRARRHRDWSPVAEEPDQSAGQAAVAGQPEGEAAGHPRKPRRRRRHGTTGTGEQENRRAGEQKSRGTGEQESGGTGEQESRRTGEQPQAAVPAGGGEMPVPPKADRVQAAVPPVAGEMPVPPKPDRAQAAVPAPVPMPAQVEPVPSAGEPVPSAGEPVPSAGEPVPSAGEPQPLEMEDELAQALADDSFDELMAGDETLGSAEPFEAESRHQGRVVAIRRGEVFVELGGREQGCVPLGQFDQPPATGTVIEVIVQRLNAQDGLYELTLPGTAVDVGDWEDVHEGMLVEAQVTGHNTGGLECEVNHLRGFIPISQVALYRVEDLSPFVGQRLSCLITEANPARRNLVLSHRAVLEREQEAAQTAFLDSLQPGQVHEGLVRKLMDFGAFVELGNGVDGLLHISQLSWGRINHPREVLTEGQSIRVKIEKFDRATGRISLAYRDMLENPWTHAAERYPHNGLVRGKVTKLMEFGAFVELEPGIEGLIHISELSHKRVWRASDVVHEGDEVEVLVLNVNPEAERISLSIKALSKPEPTKKEKEEAQEAELPSASKKRKAGGDAPLRGGLGKSAGGDRFGLNW